MHWFPNRTPFHIVFQQSFQNFCRVDCFELNYNLLTAVENQNVTNVVSFEEFANFYEYVSFLYEDDDEFVQMVNESWNE